MKTKAVIPMLVGVGIGLLALKLGWNYMERQKLSVAASQGDTPVVVAKVNIPPGSEIRLSDLTVVDWPRSTLPSQTYSDPEELEGRVSADRLVAKVPVLENMLTPPGTPPGLTALIPPGYQAVTVKVDEFTGVGGFLKPKDTVDVVATFSVKLTEAGKTETVTRTILRDIRVCAVGQKTQPDENNEPIVVRSITLLVNPQQAQKLSLAATRGTIRLALRSGQGDDAVAGLKAILFPDLLRAELEASDRSGQGKNAGGWFTGLLKSKKTDLPKTIPVKVDPHWQVKIFRGSEVQDLVFESRTSSRRIEQDSAERNNQPSAEFSSNPADWNEQDAEKFNKLLGQTSWPSSTTPEDVQKNFFGE